MTSAASGFSFNARMAGYLDARQGDAMTRGFARWLAPFNIQYLPEAPESVAAGQIVAHDSGPIERACIWTGSPGPAYEQCFCRWAPHLGTHYRIREPQPIEE